MDSSDSDAGCDRGVSAVAVDDLQAVLSAMDGGSGAIGCLIVVTRAASLAELFAGETWAWLLKERGGDLLPAVAALIGRERQLLRLADQRGPA